MVESVINIASVPQRSIFRYPGGKTWFVPYFRKWMSNINTEQKTFIEPFAGGGIISLTCAAENMAPQIIMCEIDDEIAAVWETLLNYEDSEWLIHQILNFDLTIDNTKDFLNLPNKITKEVAFSTILKNRTFHGGIITKGSGLLKHGENGKGITSRWYPTTLSNRIRAFQHYSKNILFFRQDAFNVIEENINNVNAIFFIDPPYFKAGKRLYTHFDVDHDALLNQVSRIAGNYLLTYDDSIEILELIEKYSLNYFRIPMKTTHHETKYELVITNSYFQNE